MSVIHSSPDIIGGDIALDEAIVGAVRATAALAPLLPEGQEPPVVPANPPHGPPTHHPGDRSLVRQRSIAEGPIVGVLVEQGVGAVGLDQLSLGDLLIPPAVVGSARALQGPKGHRDRNPVASEARSRAGRTYSRQVRLGEVGRDVARTFCCSSYRFQRRRSRSLLNSSRVLP